MEAENSLVTVTEDVIVKEIKRKPKKNLATWFSNNWKVLLSEFVATLLLILIGCMTCIPIKGLVMNPPIYATLGFGLVVIINIQIFGHISGAHMNPSVTFAAVVWGKMSIGLGIAYVLAQCAGAIIGYGTLMAISPIDISYGVCTTQPQATYTALGALGVEIALTLVLVFVNCATWDPMNVKKNESLTVMFGMTVAGLSMAGGPLTGASMNPARSLGPALWTSTWNTHWVYWAGPFIGSAVAVLFYKYVLLSVEKVEEQEILKWTGSRNCVERT